jgi:DNA-binding response OmpR family regulator
VNKVPVILLVEDETQLRFLLAKILRDDGCEVFEAAHGKEALEIAQLMHLDLVVTDLMMPQMGGVPFIQAMQKTEFGAYARYVILTAAGRREELEGVIPFEDFLEKPLEAEEIVTRIRAVLAKTPVQENAADPGHDLSHAVAARRRPDVGAAADLRVAQDAQMLAADKGMDAQEDKKKNEPLVFNDAPDGRGKKEERRVLIAETSKTVYQEMLKVFCAQGCSCRHIITEAQCLEACETYQPGVILLHADFGSSGAASLARRIRNIPQVKTTPILIYEKIGSLDSRSGVPGQEESRFLWDREGAVLIQRAMAFFR